MNWNRELMQQPSWKEEIKNREQKEIIAKKIAERVQDGEVIGFGSGSTSYLTAIEIANKCERENKNAMCILKHSNGMYHGKEARLVL